VHRISTTARAVLTTTLLIIGIASPAQAQGYHRFELTPFGSYSWGGTFPTDQLSNIPAGDLHENPSFSWGAILSFLRGPDYAAELMYLRQDTKVDFERQGNTTEVSDFANNYIQIGARRSIRTGSGLAPFISASVGMNILDPKRSDLDSSTRFAWTLGGGALYMAENGRVGVRLDIRWMVTPVQSGTYGSWCSVWGCYATGGMEWLHQGQAGAGLILPF
jgi:hypothetical protein